MIAAWLELEQWVETLSKVANSEHVPGQVCEDYTV